MGIVRKEAELGIRIAKGNELEDRVALEEASGEDVARQIAADAAANVAMIAKVRGELGELSQATSSAQEELEDSREHARELEGEANTARVRLEVLQREIELARETLRQREEAEAARQAQEIEELQRRGSVRIQDAEQALAALSDEATVVRTETAELDKGLATEKECSEGLRTALKHTIESHESATAEFRALEVAAESLKSQAEDDELRAALTSLRRQCSGLQQEASNIKSEQMMRRNSIQGALEETQRMLTDHHDQTQTHIEETQRGDSNLAVLTAVLAAARDDGAIVASEKRRKEQDKHALEAEVKRVEQMLALDKARKDQLGATVIEEDISRAQQSLAAANARAAQANDDLKRAEAACAQAEREGNERVNLLRSKLQELWHLLRLQKATMPAQPRQVVA